MESKVINNGSKREVSWRRIAKNEKGSVERGPVLYSKEREQKRGKDMDKNEGKLAQRKKEGLTYFWEQEGYK